jgi:putative transcriptional regulator
VATSGVLALVRTHPKPADAKHVCGDVYLVSTKELLEKTFATAADADSFHVYLGYAGWTAEQLQNEVDAGAWFIFQGGATAVFDSEPDSLWPRLIRETELHIADNGFGLR